MQVSGAGESHSRALAEPDVNLSIHPAPVIEPRNDSQDSSAGRDATVVLQRCAPTPLRGFCYLRSFLNFRIAQRVMARLI